MTICEDAPCCGCCGTGVYGRNDRYDDDHYGYEQDTEHGIDFDPDDEYEVDPSTCDHRDCSMTHEPRLGVTRQGWQHYKTVECDLCFTEGVVVYIMGDERLIWPIIKSEPYVREDFGWDGGMEA